VSTHVLKPRPPLLAFGASAVLALVGIGLFAAPDLFGWPPVVRSIGIWALVLAVVFLGLAVLAMRRMQVQVVLDEQGYQVVGPATTTTGGWDDVTRVARADQQVILYGRDGTMTVIALPRGGAGDLDALGADIARLLDAHRGYGSVPLGSPGPAGE